MFLFFGCCSATGAVEQPPVRAAAYLLYDADLDIFLVTHNHHQRRSIASLTKIMTMLLACELEAADSLQLSDEIIASRNAASRGGTQIRLQAGDVVTLEELLYATSLASANDAAVAIAEHVAGSEAAFVRLMNERASQLGLTNTHFADATGLLHANYSTAADLARLTRWSLDNALFAQLVSTQEYHLRFQDRTIRNSNILLTKMDGVSGVKTGVTTAAGHCLVTSRTLQERTLISVVLGSGTRERRNDDSEALLEWAFSHLALIVPPSEAAVRVVIPDGITREIYAVPRMQGTLFVIGFDPDGVNYEIRIQEGLQVPVQKGDVIGEMELLVNGKTLARVPMVAEQGTGIASIWRRMVNRLAIFLRRIWGG